MAETHVLSALKRQYGKTLGLIGVGEDRAEDLAHMAAVIRMFNPNEDLAPIRSIRPYKANRGRWNRKALQILRASNEPMTPTDLAHAVMLAKGLDPTDLATRRGIMIDLVIVLARLADHGMVVATGKPRRWSVAPRRLGAANSPSTPG